MLNTMTGSPTDTSLLGPFCQLAPEVDSGLEAEVADLAHFLEVQTSLQVITNYLEKHL